MKTAVLRIRPRTKVAGARGLPARPATPGPAGIRSARRCPGASLLAPEMAALLGVKADLAQTVEGMPLEGVARLSPAARRDLAARLQAASLELLRVSVRLEEAPDSAAAATSVPASAGTVARSPAALEETARRNRDALVRTGELLTSRALAEKLRISPQAITKARTDGRFFSLEVGGGDYYPAFYADAGLDRKILEEVTRLLGDLPGAEKLAFFRSALGSLGDLTPLAALRAGKRQAVERAARAFAER